MPQNRPILTAAPPHVCPHIRVGAMGVGIVGMGEAAVATKQSQNPVMAKTRPFACWKLLPEIKKIRILNVDS
jgi:hypothetical protein